MDSVLEDILSGIFFKRALSPAIRKALVEFWGSEEIVKQPEIIVGLGPVGISRINRIGKKSLWQIAQALYSLGYIDSPDVWLLKRK